ncbi:MAG: M14 family zinc carboxypeptidase [Cyclobacteriaceae bacterium]
MNLLKKSALVFLAVLFTFMLHGQVDTKAQLSRSFHESHETNKATSITHRRFKHAEIMRLMDRRKAPLSVRQIGSSVSGKPIKMVSYGNGKTSVLLWSQMHGNEPTATMALMDIFNFFEAEGDGFDAIREIIQENLSVHFVPMLNPDGADKFVRRNDQGIDINRDALRQQTPEGRALKQVRDSLEADWGFNLHDQGRTSYIIDKSATISVLAPAYDFEKSVNEKRGDAMQLIALMEKALQEYIPDQVSQYSDDFEPRAFGDNIQKWGTRTILIESGGLVNDREKQEIRRLNYMAILMALHGIATNSYESFTTDDYFKIPRTNRGFRDVIIKNIQLPEAMGGYLTDIAYNFQEVENESRDDYYLKPILSDVGDLSTSGAYKIYDVEGYTVKPGKTRSTTLSELQRMKNSDLSESIKSGFTDFIVSDELGVKDRNSMPVKFVRESRKPSRLRTGGNPSLLFYKEGRLEYVLINGYFFSTNQSWEEILAGMKRI